NVSPINIALFLPVTEGMFQGILIPIYFIGHHHLSAVIDGASDIIDRQHITLFNIFVIGIVLELQRRKSKVKQVLPANTRIAFGNNGTLAKVTRCDGGMLTAGTLCIILTGNNDISVMLIFGFHSPVVEIFVHYVKRKLAYFRNITAKRKHFSTGAQ